MRNYPVWWRVLVVLAAMLTVTGAVLIFTGPVVLGAVLLVAAQPLNVFTALRQRAISANNA